MKQAIQFSLLPLAFFFCCLQSVDAQTQVYNIALADLFNQGSSCCAPSRYNGCNGNPTGFGWTDVIPGGNIVTGVSIQLSVGVECQAQAHTTTLNGTAGAGFNTNGNCSCCGSNNAVFTLAMPVGAYNLGAANNFRVTDSQSCFGYIPDASIGNNYARVTVTYTSSCTPPAAPSASGTTISCNNTASLSASGAPSGGSYFWYSDAGGSNQVGTGTPYVTPVLTSNTTYYVGASSATTSTTVLSNDFQAGWNGWSAPGGAPLWLRDPNNTPSGNTGPNGGSNNGTVQNGNWYAFLEVSGGGQNGSNNLTSPSFSIAGTGTLTFRYHMYGSAVGTLRAEVNNGSGWVTVWSLTGQQQGNANAPWALATVDLSAYTGNMQVRFRGTAAGYWQGDMAVDQVVVTDAVAGCISNLTSVLVTVNPLTQPTAPGVSITCDNTASLAASGSSNYIWYSDAAATNQVGTGTPFVTPVLTSNTTYYVRAGSGGCASAITSVLVTVNDPATPSAGNQTITCGSTATLTASGSIGNYIWYSDAGGTNQVGTGSPFTTPVLTTGTTYYVSSSNSAPPSQLATTQAGGNGCTGGNMFDITTNANALLLTGLTVTPYANGAQTVTVFYKTGTYAGSQTIAGAWTTLGAYAITGAAGTPLYINTADLALNASSVYGIYVQYNAQYTTGANTYSNGDMTITTGSGLCGGFTGINTPRTFNGIVHYEVPSTCESLLDPVIVNVNSLAVPTAVSANPNPICQGSTTLLSATLPAGANSARWYTASSGGPVLGTGVSYTTATLNTPGTVQYYASSYNTVTGCESSSRTLVTITVDEQPTAPTGITVTGANPLCEGGSVLLEATGGTEGDGATYEWRAGSCTFGSVLGTGSTFTVFPTTSTTYYVSRVASGANACSNTTGCANVLINVEAQPTAYAGVDQTQCGLTGYTITDASTGNGTLAATGWTVALSGGSTATITGTNTMTPNIVPTSATGSVTMTINVDGISPCSGDTDAMTMSWTAAPTANAGTVLPSCGTAGIYFINSSATAGSTVSWSILAGGTGTGTIITGVASDPTTWGFQPTSASGSKTVQLLSVPPAACSAPNITSNLTVTWGEVPSVSVTTPINTCTGDAPITISGASSAGTGTLDWQIVSTPSGAGAFTGAVNIDNPTFDPSTVTGQHTLEFSITGTGACVGFDDAALVVVNWDNPPTYTAGTDATFCETNPFSISDSDLSGSFSSMTWVDLGTGTATGSFTTTHPSDPASWVYTPTSAGTIDLQLQVVGGGSICSLAPTLTDDVTITLDPAPTVDAGPTITGLACSGSTPITLSGAIPTNSSSYNWTEVTVPATGSINQGTLIDNAEFTPGGATGSTSLTVTVMGTGACSAESASDSRIVNWFTAPIIDEVDVLDVTDCNSDNGAIGIFATGVEPFNYSIDNGTNYFGTQAFTNLPTGSYDIIIEDGNGCFVTYSGNSVVINGPAVPTFTLSNIVEPLCAGIPDGSFTLSGISGANGGPFQYALDGPGSNRWEDILSDPWNVTDLPAGSYDVVVQDPFGCVSSVTSITINEPNPILIGTPTIVDITGCGGTGTGSITVSASGGTGTLNYYLNGSVNSPATSGAWTNLVGGSYEIMVQDAIGCQSISNTSINAPWTLSAGNDASICTGSSLQLEGNIIGEYTNGCAITCTSGCGMVSSCTANGNDNDDWVSRVQFNTINQTSGQATYTDFTGVSTTVTEGNTYNLSVRVNKCCGNTSWVQCVRVFFDWTRDGDFNDANEIYDLGCGTANPFTLSTNITIPNNVVAGNVRMRVTERYNGYFSNTGCGTTTYAEVEDYTVNVQGLGACTPTLSWAHGGSSFTSTVAPTTTSTYTLTMDDGAGCIQSATVDVNVSDLDASDNLTQITCNGEDDGCIEVTAVNEVGPYLMKLGTTIQVYGGRMKPVTINNTNGTLTNHPVKISNILFTAPMRADFGDVRFYDSNLNELSYWIESYTNSSTMDAWVKFPSLPNGNTIIYMVFGNSALSSESDGDAVFEFFDDFNFFDNGKWSQGIISATTGTDWSYYGGSLNGGNTNRIQTSTMTFTGSRITEARTFESASAPNGFTNAGFWGSTVNAYNILNHNGTNYMRINNTWDNYPQPAGGQGNQWMREYVRAHTSNSLGRRTRESNGATTSQPNGNYSLSNEQIRLGARGDNVAYNQNFSARWDWMFVRPWVNTEPTATIGSVVLANNEFCDLPPASYSVLVVDMGNCSETIPFNITEPNVLAIDNIAVTNTWCYDNTHGELDLTVSGGTPTYIYNWSGPSSFSSNAEDLTGIGAGLYGILVADDNACTVTSTAIVNYNTPINSPGFTWTGMTDQLWQDPTNWDCGIPNATSVVIIPAAPIGVNTPIIQNGIIGNVLNIDVQGTTPALLEIQNGGLLRVYEP